ncbi:MAG: hypothetical protein KAI53_05195 [Candidatus Aenigmarchaeota archaeon]|nr:hypothetical protein [Candidatus Aenigmarchaeota archaeon]
MVYMPTGISGNVVGSVGWGTSFNGPSDLYRRRIDDMRAIKPSDQRYY